MSRGREPNLTERLAACLLMLKRGNGEPLLPIDRETAKSMTAQEIVALAQFHHVISKKLGGTNHPTNLDPMWTPDHRKFEAEVGAKVHAKANRFERLRKTGTKRTAAQQKAYRPIRSRPFPTKEERRAFLERVQRR